MAKMQTYCLSEKWSSREGILGTAIAGCALRISTAAFGFPTTLAARTPCSRHPDRGSGDFGDGCKQPPSPNHFVLLSRLAFFAWGEIVKLLPSIMADLLGPRMATINYGIVYTSKGTASMFADPVATVVMTKTSSSVPVFYVMIARSVIAAFMALPFAKAACEAYDRPRGPNLPEQKAETEAEKERVAAP